MTWLVAVLLAAAPDAGAAPAMKAPAATVVHELVDRVIATVNKDAITLSDLDRQAQVIAILSKGPQGVALVGSRDFINMVMEMLINQMLVIQEMRKQAGYSQGVGDEDAKEQIKNFAKKFPDPQAYRQFLQAADMTEEMVRDILLRDLRVERFLATKSKQVSTVTDEEAEVEFKKSPNAFGGKKWPEAAPVVKSFMSRARSEKFRCDLLRDVCGRYGVRFIWLPPGMDQPECVPKSCSKKD